MKNAFKNFILIILFFLIVGWVVSAFRDAPANEEIKDLGSLIASLRTGSITRVVVEENTIRATHSDGKVLVVQKEIQDSFSDLVKNFDVDPSILNSIPVEIKRKEGIALLWESLAPFLVPFLVVLLIMFFLFRQVQGANNRAISFGQSTARETSPNDKKNKINFSDVAGETEAKEELKEVVEFLKSPKKFIQLGAKIPKGVLLMGAPGTGKTLLARAVAGEANVPFFHVSGSEFVEMFVGVGAARVRSLFAKAKKNAPSILFIDELDALGRQRGTGIGGSHDEREQTLNQILVEVDGFEANSGVIVIAATNRPDVLDRALLRPGRFDRKVVLDVPDIKSREEILKIHAKGKPIAKEVNLRVVAERTPGFTGADLANVLNEAAILAARKDKTQIEKNDILSSIEKVLLGPERKNHILTPKEKHIVAYHEAGHALIQHLLPNADPMQKVSIVSRGSAGGYTIGLPTEDRHLHTTKEYEARIAVALGGYIAEKIIFGEVTDGARSDLKRVTQIARALVTELGMSQKLGPRVFGEREELVFLGREITEQRDYSEKTAQLIDAEVDFFVRRSYAAAEQILKKNHAKLEVIVKKLMEVETLEREEFEELMGPKPKDEPLPLKRTRIKPQPQKPRRVPVAPVEV